MGIFTTGLALGAGGLALRRMRANQEAQRQANLKEQRRQEQRFYDQRQHQEDFYKSSRAHAERTYEERRSHAERRADTAVTRMAEDMARAGVRMPIPSIGHVSGSSSQGTMGASPTEQAVNEENDRFLEQLITLGAIAMLRGRR